MLNFLNSLLGERKYMDTNKNSKNLDYCSSCSSCSSCYSCSSCSSCYYCSYCSSCYSCYSCSYCSSCSSCSSCYYCSYCSSCYSCYSCYSSKGLRMSENMLFCLGEGSGESKGIGYQKNNMVFNQQVTKEEFEKINGSIPTIKLPLNSWIYKKDMTDDEKENVSGWPEMGGYLKTLGYEEAWAKWWNEANTEDKEKILNIPQFDGKIFTEITGIKDFKSKSLKGKKVSVEFDGIKYTAVIE